VRGNQGSVDLNQFGAKSASGEIILNGFQLWHLASPFVMHEGVDYRSDPGRKPLEADELDCLVKRLAGRGGKLDMVFASRLYRIPGMRVRLVSSSCRRAPQSPSAGATTLPRGHIRPPRLQESSITVEHQGVTSFQPNQPGSSDQGVLRKARESPLGEFIRQWRVLGEQASD